MTFSFRPGVREMVNLLIGMAGGTGSGKTYSAFELAAGICGDKPFAVVDTEARRALHYADKFKFDHGELRPPFRPAAYLDAIIAADAAGYPAIVVDSASHEWAGEGGLLDWHEEMLSEIVERKRAFAESKGWQFDEWKTRDANTFNAWIDPKIAHKKFVEKLLQIRAHLILCFRAEEKIEIVKLDDDGNVLPEGARGGKTKVRPKETATGRDGWVPICEKKLPFELTCSFLLKAENPGVGVPIKLQDQHRAMFPAGEKIGRKSGEAIARWAAGAPAQPHRPSDALASFLAGVESASSETELKAIVKHAEKLSDQEKAEARTVYAAKMAQVKAA